MYVVFPRFHVAISSPKVNGTGEQHTAEVVGKDFEQQLLFGDHAEAGATGSSSTSSRIQAGFIVVQIDGVSSTRTAIPQAADLISNDNIRELEGAAWAQQATTAPIMIVCSHFARWKRVEAALATASAPSMGDSDATVQRFILAGMHGGASQAMTDQVAMLQKGVVLCFDCFGRVEWLPEADYYPSDEESAVRIAMLVRQGFADKIVLSQGVSRRIHLSRYVNSSAISLMIVKKSCDLVCSSNGVWVDHGYICSVAKEDSEGNRG